MKSSRQQDYFNTSNEHPQSIGSEKHKSVSKTSYFAGVTAILSLISLIILIMLNITTLVKTYQEDDHGDKCLEYYAKVADTVTNIRDIVQSEMQPKVNLITSSTSYTIPSMIDNLGNLVVNEINTKCSQLILNDSCSKTPPSVNDMRFSLLNTKATDRCLADSGTIGVPSDIQFINYPSFVPASTIPDSCTRYPSFALSSTIFSYSHTLYPVTCDAGEPLSQTWLLGYIGNSDLDQPEPRVVASWNMVGVNKRTHCSVTAGESYGWLGCTLYQVGISSDLKDTEVRPIMLAYMDTMGRKREWIYQYSDIEKDKVWGFLRFGVGSGIILDGYVHFLVYGTLTEDYEGNVYCPNVGCPSQTQENCNNAAQTIDAGGKVLVNGIISFLDNPNIRPTLKLKTIPPSLNFQGGPGRLIYDRMSDKIIVYIKSSGWNPYLQIGYLYNIFPLNITWVKYTSYLRPGGAYCDPTNKCPNKCITGSYTDAYPITSDLRLVITCALNSLNTYKNPRLISATPTEVTGEYQIFRTDTASGETSTTCFMYDGYIWCLSLVENANVLNFNIKITPFLFKLTTKCSSESWWTAAQMNGYIKYLTPYVPKTVSDILDRQKLATSEYSRLPMSTYNQSNDQTI